jgi:hypothetical protein
MRCGTHLIHAGGGPDSANMYEVLKKAGGEAGKHMGLQAREHAQDADVPGRRKTAAD